MFPPPRGRGYRVRPGRGQSLVGGIGALTMGLFAVSMGAPGFFFVFALLIAGLSFYNAFSEHGISEYEVESFEPHPGHPAAADQYCPECGKGADASDDYCAKCGSALKQ